jgi:hypothetical protein
LESLLFGLQTLPFSNGAIDDASLGVGAAKQQNFTCKIHNRNVTSWPIYHTTKNLVEDFPLPKISLRWNLCFHIYIFGIQ